MEKMSNKRRKNFQIEAFKQPVIMDPNYADKTWNILEHAIREIYNHNFSCLSFEDLYRNAYNMVLHNFGGKLYSGLVTTITTQLKEIARSIEATQGSSFLEELNRKWNDHNAALQMIREILMYMDTTYVPSFQQRPVYELGLFLWRENVIYSNQIGTRLLNMLLELVRNERAGEVINRGLFRSITNMLADLGPYVYGQAFETHFLQTSVEFYCVESQKFIESCGCGDYLKRVERCLNEEMDRVRHYLEPMTEKKIIDMVEKEMIENHMLSLIHMENSGLVNMLCDDKYEDLGRMYSLFGRVTNGLSKLREVMTSHIRQLGKQLVTDPEMMKDPIDFVQRLLDEKDKYDKIIKLGFNNDKVFQNALSSSFEFFTNLNPRSPEFISLFVDENLREVLNGVSKNDLEITLDKVMVLFRYLEEKDVFEKYYKQHLANRLLSETACSYNAERSFIAKLKKECGHQFTSKLEGMLTDMITSLYTMVDFHASHLELRHNGPTLILRVLTTGFWPMQPSVPCNLPSEISTLCEMFQSYYLGVNTHRKLSWQTSLGTAKLKATFGTQRYKLIVSTYHMCILMLFNDVDRLSFKDIQQATEIQTSNLKRCLHTLALVEGKNVLMKEPMSNNVDEGDIFFVNENFYNRFYKVEIGNIVAQMEAEPEKLETQKKVEEDRKPHIDAAIVRIMKSKKLLDHKNLVAEVTKLLHMQFLPNPTDVKKRIESLIEREFLERDKFDIKLYRYVP